MSKSLELKLNKNFLLTIRHVTWIRETATNKTISESELIRNLIDKEMVDNA